MESGSLEGPSEGHGGVLLDDVGKGLLALGTFPRLHGSVGPRIRTLNPRQSSEEGTRAEWLVGKRAPTLLPPGAVTVPRPTLNWEVPDEVWAFPL